jgi:hypothetical protein
VASCVPCTMRGLAASSLETFGETCRAEEHSPEGVKRHPCMNETHVDSAMCSPAQGLEVKTHEQRVLCEM